MDAHVLYYQHEPFPCRISLHSSSFRGLGNCCSGRALSPPVCFSFRISLGHAALSLQLLPPRVGEATWGCRLHWRAATFFSWGSKTCAPPAELWHRTNMTQMVGTLSHGPSKSRRHRSASGCWRKRISYRNGVTPIAPTTAIAPSPPPHRDKSA